MPEATAIRIPLPTPFDFPLVLFGHGFIDLLPHRWDSERAKLQTVIDGADAVIEQRGKTLVVRTKGNPARIRRAVIRMLRLDEDLSKFWRVCAVEPELAWVSRRGAGRLLRSPTLFEDLTKLLMTTNCSWAGTRNMVTRLVESLGPRRKGFPTAARCAEKNAGFYRDTVRMGYRAESMVKLARGFASGKLSETGFDDPALSTDEVRDRLLALPGFGPYAAGQALRLLGRYDDLALDSWCRGEFAKKLGKKRPPSDRSIERRYARFGEHRGLVLWMELTARWHGESKDPPSRILNVER